MKSKSQKEQINQELRFKNRIIFVLITILAVALYKFSTYPSQLSIHTAPDISKSFVQKVGDVPNESVYGFARTIWETINYCEHDCKDEYEASLNKYRVFLTKSCYQELSTHFDKNKGLYDMRSRRLLPTGESAFDLSRVKKVSNGTWYTYMQYLLDDDIGGIKTRKQIMEYPIKVVSAGVPTAYNPWGLAIDCFWDEVKVEKFEVLEEIK